MGVVCVCVYVCVVCVSERERESCKKETSFNKEIGVRERERES